MEEKRCILPLYTKRGDKGTTTLYDQTKVNKGDFIMDVLGNIDLLNSYIGVVCSLGTWYKTDLRRVQSNLMSISSLIATPTKIYRGTDTIPQFQITYIEQMIDEMQQRSRPLKDFVLPSGHCGSFCHVCRCLARQVERDFCRLCGQSDVEWGHNTLVYLNRLSDMFFALSRLETVADVTWKSVRGNVEEEDEKEDD